MRQDPISEREINEVMQRLRLDRQQALNHLRCARAGVALITAQRKQAAKECARLYGNSGR